MKKWYCYICGEILNKEYYLVSLNKSTDRVFLVCNNKCINQIDGKMFCIKIKENKNEMV